MLHLGYIHDTTFMIHSGDIYDAARIGVGMNLRKLNAKKY